MPSQELTGAGEREHVEGVGALPGAVGEFDVTELPDQREGAQLPTTEGAMAMAAGTAGAAAAGIGAAAYEAKQKAKDYGKFTAIIVHIITDMALLSSVNLEPSAGHEDDRDHGPQYPSFARTARCAAIRALIWCRIIARQSYRARRRCAP